MQCVVPIGTVHDQRRYGKDVKQQYGDIARYQAVHKPEFTRQLVVQTLQTYVVAGESRTRSGTQTSFFPIRDT